MDDANLGDVGNRVNEATLLGVTAGDTTRDTSVVDVITRMATMTARRMCNQHDCRATHDSPCEHPDHRRDVDYLRHVLDVLGLPGDFQQPSDGDHDELMCSLRDLPTSSLPLTNPEPGG